MTFWHYGGVEMSQTHVTHSECTVLTEEYSQKASFSPTVGVMKRLLSQGK